MSGRVGSITTDIIADGLVLNMDAANRASCIPSSNTTIVYNTVDLSVSGSLSSADGELPDPTYIGPPTSASCWTFDGVDDYIDCGNSSLFDDLATNGVFTISLWAKWGTQLDASSGLFQLGGSTGGTNRRYFLGLGFGTYDSGYIQWGTGNSTSITTDHRIGDDNLDDYNWHHIVIASNGTAVGDAEYYIDGSGGPCVGTSGVGSITEANLIGSRGLVGFIAGNIANIQIYNRKLSANEVLHNYNALKGRFI